MPHRQTAEKCYRSSVVKYQFGGINGNRNAEYDTWPRCVMKNLKEVSKHLLRLIAEADRETGANEAYRRGTSQSRTIFFWLADDFGRQLGLDRYEVDEAVKFLSSHDLLYWRVYAARTVELTDKGLNWEFHQSLFNSDPTSGSVIMGDQIIGGQKAGGDIVGRDKAGGDIVHGDKVYGDMWKQVAQQGTDAAKLAEELGLLLGKLQMEAQSTEQRESLLNASKAHDAAKAGDGTKAIEYLKAAGKWFFDAATKLGLDVGLAFVKQKLGF